MVTIVRLTAWLESHPAREAKIRREDGVFVVELREDDTRWSWAGRAEDLDGAVGLALIAWTAVPGGPEPLPIVRGV